MPQRATLPPQWACLDGRVDFVQKHSEREYSCSCPVCGGEMHRDGAWPDRCRLFVDAHPVLWCRRCNLTGYPDQFGAEGYARPTAEETRRWNEERQAELRAAVDSIERQLSHLRSTKFWEQLNSMMGDRERLYWRQRGISDGWQDYWQLGFDHQRDSLTIPLFGTAWEFENMKLRYLHPREGQGKYGYRLETAPLPKPFFICAPDMPVGGDVIVVEGEIKSMVVYTTLDDSKAVVLGLPAVTPNMEYAKKVLANCDRITLVLDPDAETRTAAGRESPAERLVNGLGRERTKLLIPPLKIDDGILAGRMGKRALRQLLACAC